MTGGLLQLKAYGSENIYLNANPQISFFRSIYRRHTNFSMENFNINYVGTPNMTEDTNTTFTFNINRYGDLLGPIFLVLRLPSVFSSEYEKFQWIKNIGANIINTATLFIAGQRICFINGETINNIYRLQKDYATNLNYNELIGHSPTLYNPTMLNPQTNTYTYKFSRDNPNNSSENLYNPSILGSNLYIPIPFYFTNNSGLYLPLIALQKAEVQIVVELKRISEIFTILESRKTEPLYNKRIKPNPNIGSQSILHFIKEKTLPQAFQIHLDAQFIFLDNDERTQFAELPHEYLIEQIQYSRFFGIDNHRIVDLVFFHPTKEIRFYLRKTDNGILFNQWSNYGNNDIYGEKYMEGLLNNSIYRNEMTLNNIREQLSVNLSNVSLNILRDAKFLMNGQDRTTSLPYQYWNLVQPFQYHLGSSVYPFQENDQFNVFSFSLEPDNFQPSGTCNLTNLKSFQLEINTVQPPLSKYFFLASYSITFNRVIINGQNTTIESTPLFSNRWRNPDYSLNNAIDNVFTPLFEFYSLETTSSEQYEQSNNQPISYYGKGIVYGSLLMRVNNNSNYTQFNVKIFPVRYDITNDGTIRDNRIFNDPECRIEMYNINDINFERVLNTILFRVPTLRVTQLELFFVYKDQPINNEHTLQFFNINLSLSIYNTYVSNISKTEYDNLVNPIVQITNLPYNTIYKTMDTILSEQIQSVLQDSGQSNSNSNNFVIIAVDFTNYKIYGKLTVIQTSSSNQNTIITTYNAIIGFANVRKVGNTYVIPLTRLLLSIYPENNLNFQPSDLVAGFPQQFLPYSLIIFTITPLTNNNPNNLKNYLWNYDLFIEAHNYNLLRISNGTGAVAFST